MAGGYRKKIRKFTGLLRDLGWRATVRYYRNRWSGDRIVCLRLPGYDTPVYYRRKNRTDMNLLRKILCRGAGDPGLELEDGLIIDGGANAGYVTIALARRYPDCRIVAVEPDPANFELLQMNVAALPNASAVQGALWSESGSIQIENPEAKTVSYRVSARGNGISVPAYSIADLMARAQEDSVSLLKLDIEGAEYELLRHNWQPWFGTVRALMVELHERYAPGLGELLDQRLATRPHRRGHHDEYELVAFGD